MAPERCGDEPLLIARHAGVPVQVESDRVAAARSLVADGCTLIIADDGLQHRRLGRDIEIEVLDGERRHGNGRLIPAGPLREPASRRTDLRVVNGGTAADGEWPMLLEPAEVQPLHAGPARPLSSFAPGPVHAVAGIGNPERFFRMLREWGIETIAHPFPDHHGFVASDLALVPPLPLLMTEKDAVKCASFGLPEAYAVPVQARLPTGFFAALHSRLAEWSRVHDPA
jgi:tetraacyldisaccharide 4'-kinase